jgi:peroxiredoxin
MLNRRLFWSMLVTTSAFVGSVMPSMAQVIPRPAPDYSIQLPNGQKVSLSQYKGKVVVLEFLLTTCSHCQKTGQILAQLHKELGPKGFQPIGAAINDNPDIPGFLQITKGNYPVGVAQRDTVYGFLQHSIMSPNLMMPQMVIIDRNGVIQEQYAGTEPYFQDQEKNIRASVEKLLGAKAAPASTVKPGAAKPAKRAAASPQKKTSLSGKLPG